MSRLVRQIEEVSRGYGRKGGKENRASHRKRMAEFGVFCASLGASDLGQVGARHVIRYWNSPIMQSYCDRTRINHYYALAALWRCAGKPEKPPRPRPVGLTEETVQPPSRVESTFKDD